MLSWSRWKRPAASGATATVSDDRWLSELRATVRQAESSELIYDISDVTRIDSHQLGELAKIELALREKDRHLVLENACAVVCEVFELTRMDRLIEVRGCAEEDVGGPAALP